MGLDVLSSLRINVFLGLSSRVFVPYTWGLLVGSCVFVADNFTSMPRRNAPLTELLSDEIHAQLTILPNILPLVVLLLLLSSHYKPSRSLYPVPPSVSSSPY